MIGASPFACRDERRGCEYWGLKRGFCITIVYLTL